jgi:hypothetical protein
MINAIAGPRTRRAANGWQEARPFHLPNSGLGVSASTLGYEFLPGEGEVLPDFAVLPELGDWGPPQDAGVRFVFSQ